MGMRIFGMVFVRFIERRRTFLFCGEMLLQKPTTAEANSTLEQARCAASNSSLEQAGGGGKKNAFAKAHRSRRKPGFREGETMKKIIALLITAVLALCMLSACGGGEGNKTDNLPAAGGDTAPSVLSGELNIYAAASMTESLDKVIGLFNAQYPDVQVNANYQSSGDLVKAIVAGGVCDIFISAGAKQMNQIDSTATPEENPDGNDFVVQGTRFKMLQNKCVLVTPDDNPASLASFDDLKNAFTDPAFLFAKGGEDVPVGEYTTAILAYLGIDEKAVEGQINYCENVKAVQAAVKEGAVSAGVVYATDAYSAKLKVIDTATDEMTGKTVTYPAAQITTGENSEAAKVFLDFMMSKEAAASFEEVGFTVLKK